MPLSINDYSAKTAAAYIYTTNSRLSYRCSNIKHTTFVCFYVILLLTTSTSIYCFRICNIIPPLFVFPENYSFTDNL